MDIVERLQGMSRMKAMTWVTADKSKRPANIYSEAADQIELLAIGLDDASKKCGKLEDEIERLREALKWIAECEGGDIFDMCKEMRDTARSALQQKESE